MVSKKGILIWRSNCRATIMPEEFQHYVFRFLSNNGHLRKWN
jgi:hypothetical protein